jgi:hypothetical protein
MSEKLSMQVGIRSRQIDNRWQRSKCSFLEQWERNVYLPSIGNLEMLIHVNAVAVKLADKELSAVHGHPARCVVQEDAP